MRFDSARASLGSSRRACVVKNSMPRNVAQWTGIVVTTIIVLGRDIDVVTALPFGIAAGALASGFVAVSRWQLLRRIRVWRRTTGLRNSAAGESDPLRPATQRSHSWTIKFRMRMPEYLWVKSANHSFVTGWDGVSNLNADRSDEGRASGGSALPIVPTRY